MSSLPPAAPAWRNFSFFDAAPVKDAHDLNASPEVFKNTPEISSVISSSTSVLVADIYGTVHILSREFETQRAWIAYDGGRVTHMAERNGVLVTVGEDGSSRAPMLKIWDLEKKTVAPPLIRSTKIQLNKPHPVCTIALSTTLSHLAIGFADGTVYLYRHLDQSVSNNTAIPKPRTVHESPGEPITGLGSRAQRHWNGKATVVDDVGCGLGCAAMDWRGHEWL
ncbi:unnamed protein product [Mycena citricolor]|uniref:PEP5/VPS11 N-terminal domain-containing protein n=1 Tax=Mycena citricolor TaxID=2018698 RepID=A0AAD2GYH7_9AGAR|nr:unnamed protein product [Mycena citricolor]